MTASSHSEGQVRHRLLRVATNILAGAGAQAITAVAGLWAIPCLFGLVGSEGYGLFSVAGALVGYCSVADLGLGNATLQRLARARVARDVQDVGCVIASSAVMLLGIGVAVSAALAILAQPLAELLTRTEESRTAVVVLCIRLCAMAAIPALIRPLLEAMLASSERLVPCYAVATIANLVRTVGAVAVTTLYPDVAVAVGALVVATALQTFLLVPFAWRAVPELSLGAFRPRFEEVRNLARISGLSWLSNASATLTNQADRVIVSWACGLEAAGRYAVAVDVTSRLWLLPNVIGRAYFARLSSVLFSRRTSDDQIDIKLFFLATTLSAGALAVPLAFYAAPVLAVFASGSEGGGFAGVLAVLAIGTALNVAAHSPIVVMQLKLDLSLLAAVNGAGLLLNLLFSSMMTPVYGPIASAVTWATVQGLVCVVIHLAAARRHGVDLRGELSRVAAGLASAAIAMYFLVVGDPLGSVLDAGRAAGGLDGVLARLVLGALATMGVCAAAVGLGRWRVAYAMLLAR